MTGILFFTLKIAILSTLLAALIGVPAAFFTAKRNFFGRSLILGSSVIPLCIPSIIIALGYVLFFGMNGYANKILSSLGNFFSFKPVKLTFLYSYAGIIIAQGFYNFPFITGAVNDAWQELDSRQENAARLLGAGELRVLFTVTLPRLSGAIGAACIPVFLFCFFSFMIVLLLSPPGCTTLEVEIFHSMRSSINLSYGAKLAVLQTFVALIIVLFYSATSQKSQTTSSGADFAHSLNQKNSRSKMSIGERFFFILLAVLILLFLFFPLCCVVLLGFSKMVHGHEAFSLNQFKSLFTSFVFWKALWNTIWIGSISAFLCTLVSFGYSVLVRFSNKRGNSLLLTVPFLPRAISSVVIGFAAAFFFRRGNIPLLIFLQVFLFWAIAYRQVQNGINQIANDTERAALIFSKSRFDAILRVYLPSCKTSLISSFGLCFAISAGDVTLPLMIAIPDFTTLALYTYRLTNSFRYNAACACALILGLLCLGIKNNIIYNFFHGKYRNKKN